MERIELLGFAEMDQAALLNTGGGCDWVCPVMKAAGQATRAAVDGFMAVGEALYKSGGLFGTIDR